MIVVRFKHKHIEMIKPWFEYYKLPSDMPLPQIGFIVEDLAAGFLRRVEGNYALFDGLIANPESSGKKRNEALNAVTKRIIQEAMNLEITKILGFSKESAVIRRSLNHGFELQPDRFIFLAL